MRVAVLLPARDEEESLPGVLEELRAAGYHNLVVVDNGSRDRTADVAREGGGVVVTEAERGYGAACLSGIRHLIETGPPDLLVFMDADGSDDPRAIRDLLAPLESDEADLVIGVRASPPGAGSHAVPLHARLGNALVKGGARLLHGAHFRDLGPFRAVRFPTLLALDMDDRTWGWTLQMQLRAHRSGARVVEVEVPHRPRVAGRSKVSGTLEGSIRAGGKMLLTLVTEMRRRTATE